MKSALHRRAPHSTCQLGDLGAMLFTARNPLPA
jgi:hypothetical protein